MALPDSLGTQLTKPLFALPLQGWVVHLPDAAPPGRNPMGTRNWSLKGRMVPEGSM